MDVRIGLLKRLRAEDLMLLNCGAEEDSESPLDRKETKPVNHKGRTGAEAPILWPPDVKS